MIPSASTPRRFTREHMWVALALLALFAALIAWATGELLSIDAGESRVAHALWVAPTAASTPLGPLTGAIARRGQSCCLAWALQLLGPAAALLAAGVLPQLLPPARARAWRLVRLAAWGLGWFAWFASGIASLGHALE